MKSRHANLRDSSFCFVFPPNGSAREKTSHKWAKEKLQFKSFTGFTAPRWRGMTTSSSINVWQESVSSIIHGGVIKLIRGH